MKFYGKSEEVASKLIDSFETGNIPEALAQVFINRSDQIPCSSWSWRNRLIMAIHGTRDARGFNQWKKVGRKVSKGTRAIHILAPCIGKRKETCSLTHEEREITFVYGFKSVPVFAIESTEVTDQEKWDANSGIDNTEEARLKGLPLIDVAKHWGLEVTSFTGQNGSSLGYYQHGKEIGLGTENLSTWAHELVHASEDRLKNLTKGFGQQQDNEIVAEFGGAVLLQIMGYEYEADLGGAWDYIKKYSENDKSKALSLCGKFIDRICKSVDLIIETAGELEIEKVA